MRASSKPRGQWRVELQRDRAPGVAGGPPSIIKGVFDTLGGIVFFLAPQGGERIEVRDRGPAL